MPVCTMRETYIKCLLLLYGLPLILCKDTTVLGSKEGELKDVNGFQLNNAHELKDLYYNPVLQNASVVSEYFREKTNPQKHKASSRKKRSTNRNCSGMCERSLCTWREEWDEERSRVPRFIKYAVCDSPRCNFEFAGLDNTAMFTLQIETYCDVVRTEIQVIEDGHEKWLTDWPVACVCTQRVVDVHDSNRVNLRHPGREETQSSSLGQIDVDITDNESLTPVSRQRIVLNGAPHRSLTRAQRRRLRNQQRRMQNIESWEQVMQRRRNRS